jgi:NAD(P)-dependent dehydrogenase (short-subunit alcohol dehydrogenase family)
MICDKNGEMENSLAPSDGTPWSLDALLPLKDKLIVVTGASSGIGERFAQVLDGLGARTLLIARRETRLRSVVSMLRSAEYLVGDVSDDASRTGLIAQVLERGIPDGLVNNAGVAHVVPAVDEQVEDFRRVLDVNLTAVFSMSALLARAAIENDRDLSIVNVASVLGHLASGQIPQASYAASKGGVVNLTRELAAQWAKQRIRVNAICPGWFPSEMTSEMFDNPSGTSWIARRTPMGRPGMLSELDGALVYLLSSASSYMTGQSLIIDGGWSII